ncbi:MAG: DNA polymerase I [Clostridia bacterium]|nr:DNA polymerase I [Clostridia bacterium]
MKDVFLILDGNSLLHRAYHALPLLSTPEGVYTNAIHGFLMMLLKAVREENAAYLAVCFDEHAPTFRHKAYPEYKAGRRKTDPELVQQFGTLHEVLDALGVRQYSLTGWEADDLLGTLSRLGTEAGVAPLLLTGDRDALQLVGHGASLLFTRKGLSETERFTPERVWEVYGFTPDQVTDWKGLAGDSSDNIPGIPGIGDKTAVKLLQEYGNLENVLTHAGEVKGKLGEKLRDGADQARMCKALATIHRDAPVEWHLADCAVPDFRQGVPMLQKLRLRQVVERITGEKAAPAAPVPANAAAAPAADDSAPALLPFPERTETADAAGIRAWLAATAQEARPLALYCSDVQLSLADGAGRCLTATLAGDLLNPGLTPGEALQALSEELCAHPARVHDGKRLLHLLRREGIALPERFAWDTMLGAYLLNPQEKSYAFRTLCGELPEDACGLMSLARWQEARVEAEGMLPLMRDVEQPLSHVLYRMEEAGFTVDPEFLRALGQRYMQEIERLKDEIYTACGVPPFNLNSPQQLGNVLFEQLMLPHGKKTSKGYSTSAEVLEELRPIAPEIIDPLLRYRQLVKLNGTYIEGMLPLIDREGRIHSYFDQVATATGRISSSEPNLQNIPVRTAEGREIREAFLPRPGWVLIDADYSQIELRLMAHFSGDRALVEAFTEGQDVHARTASEIFEVPLEEVTPELRSRAKAVNFGLIYGISGFGLARNTGVTRAEAASFIRRYFERYPGVKRFMDQAAEDGKTRGWAVTLMGRRRYLPELSSKVPAVREFGKRAAMNTPVQGTAADIIKAAMVEVDRRLRAEGLQSRLILQVHDELILESPPEEAERASRLLRESMEGVLQLKVPLLAEVHTGANWAEAK